MSNPVANNTVVMIQEKFRGPPFSGNGGYVSGRFAELLVPDGSAPVEVTLRSPVPLDKNMDVSATEEGLNVTFEDTLVAQVSQLQSLPLVIPEPPSMAAALAAQPGSYSFTNNINHLVSGQGFHPICFCCGADHEDGARVFAAPVADNQVAAVWPTRNSWANADGKVPDSYLWTAMDCPGQFAYYATGIRTGMLGRMTALVHRRPEAGETLLVTAWPIEIERKKHFAGAAIFTESGELVSEAITVWIGDRTSEMNATTDA